MKMNPYLTFIKAVHCQSFFSIINRLYKELNGENINEYDF